MKKLLYLFALFLISCVSESDPIPTNAKATFTFEVPEEVFDYTEITICYNENNDAKWEPMFNDSFTVTYNVDELPATLPVVIICKPTNRPSNKEWPVIMKSEVVMGSMTQSHYWLDNITARCQKTYGVKISNTGAINYIN